MEALPSIWVVALRSQELPSNTTFERDIPLFSTTSNPDISSLSLDATGKALPLRSPNSKKRTADYDHHTSRRTGSHGSRKARDHAQRTTPQQCSFKPLSLTSPPASLLDKRSPRLSWRPDCRPISQEQLASEVKSIYVGLTMVEMKCIHVDRAQPVALQEEALSRVAHDHWQALIALHRTLLHEHHDFFLASQHPSASPALRSLAAKYFMPARMWKHGIHSFLELLRRRLPESLDYMLAFIYLAYQMMALLYETVPAFEDTWIECLGDLSRYRMAIEDDDLRDRETWAGVARSWYTKAADKNPTVGRLYHHLAILARPNSLQQLYYYSRSLDCVKPLHSIRESISTLLDPILGRRISTGLPVDTSFISAHALLFKSTSPAALEVPSDYAVKGRLYTASSNFVDYGGIDDALHLKVSAVYCTILRLEAQLRGECSPLARLLRLVSRSLKAHKSVIATYVFATILPTVAAAGGNELPQTPPDTCAPTFTFESPLKFIVPGLILIYLAVLLILYTWKQYLKQAFGLSFITGIMMGLLSYVEVLNCKDFPGGTRAGTLEVWFASTIHVGLRYCYDSRRHLMRNIVSFLVLLVIYTGVVLRFPTLPPLGTLPLYTSFVSLIIWALHEYGQLAARRQRGSDPEQGHQLQDFSSADGGARQDEIATPAGTSVRRRNSIPIRGSAPESSNFIIGDDDSGNDMTTPRGDSTTVAREV